MRRRMRAEQRRELLLKAALELFAANGYDDTTTKAVAESTGVTEAMLFRHFASKRELFYAVLGEFGPKQFLPVDDRTLNAMPVPDALRVLITEYLEGMWLHRDWVRVLWRESAHDELAAGELRKQYRAVGSVLRRVLDLGAKRGEVQVDVIPAALQVISLSVRGFVARAARRPPDDWEVARDEFASNLVHVIFYGICDGGAT